MIGADAYINGSNLGTGSSSEMAEWLQYMTSDKPTVALTARERARNGHPKTLEDRLLRRRQRRRGDAAATCLPSITLISSARDANFLKAPQGARPIINVASGRQRQRYLLDLGA